MNEIYYINKNTLTNIADAIRAATGGTEAIEVGKLGQRTSEAFVQKVEERDSSWITRNISGYYENNKIENIGSYAFINCGNLTEVSFPACTSIGSSAFDSCTNLTSISFPACTSIGAYAFYSCTNLTSISFPACTSIEPDAFIDCYNLTTISFPACRSIGIYAFYSCANLTSVSFPACMSIGSSAFYSCTSLTSISFPACTSIGDNAFGYCSNLTSISFPVCTNIGSYAFFYCSNLTSVSIPACTSIRAHAFINCYNLTSVSLPACTNIRNSAFARCHVLSALTLGASTICTLSNSNVFYSTPYQGYSTYFSGTPHIYVPSSLVASYQAATNWTYFSSYFKAIGTENEINFTIDGVAYTAINGMTWAEWCDSEYNTAGLTAPDYVRYNGGGKGVATAEDTMVLASDLIIADHNYIKGSGPLPPI